MNAADLARFLEVPLEVEALIDGPRLSIGDLLALKKGSIIETERAAGENVDVLAGKSPLGVGELSASKGHVIVRVLRFQGEK